MPKECWWMRDVPVDAVPHIWGSGEPHRKDWCQDLEHAAKGRHAGGEVQRHLFLQRIIVQGMDVTQLAFSHQIFVPFRGLTDWDSDPEWSWATRGQDGNDGEGHPADAETSWRVSPDTGRFRLLDRGIFAGGAGPSPIKLEQLRKIPGFENVVVAGPVGGKNLWSLGHDLVFTDNTLLVPPTENYFAAGSKANMVDVQPCINSGISGWLQCGAQCRG